MIKSVLSSTLISSLFLLIQTTWLKNGLFWGVIPDFALLVILWVAYYNKDSQGVLAGFLAGLVGDAMSSSPFGYLSFIYVVPAYLASLLRRALELDAFFMPVLLGFAGTIAKGLASIVLLLLFGSSQINAYSLGDFHFWMEAALNGAMAPPLFWLLRKAKPILVTKRAGS